MSEYQAVIKKTDNVRQYNEDKEAAIAAGKIPVDVCCDHTKEVYDRLFERFKVDEKILEVFKQGFYKHRLTDIQQYLNRRGLKTVRDIRIPEYADEVFGWANMLTEELQDFFLEQFLFEVERQNIHHNLWVTRDNLKVEIKTRRERQIQSQQGKKISGLILSNRYGAKADFLRVMNALFELHFFNDETGKPLTKESFMNQVGQAFNTDLSGFSDNLNQAYNNTKMEANLKIFTEMEEFTKNRCLGGDNKT